MTGGTSSAIPAATANLWKKITKKKRKKKRAPQKWVKQKPSPSDQLPVCLRQAVGAEAERLPRSQRRRRNRPRERRPPRRNQPGRKLQHARSRALREPVAAGVSRRAKRLEARRKGAGRSLIRRGGD